MAARRDVDRGRRGMPPTGMIDEGQLDVGGHDADEERCSKLIHCKRGRGGGSASKESEGIAARTCSYVDPV